MTRVYPFDIQQGYLGAEYVPNWTTAMREREHAQQNVANRDLNYGHAELRAAMMLLHHMKVYTMMHEGALGGSWRRHTASQEGLGERARTEPDRPLRRTGSFAVDHIDYMEFTNTDVGEENGIRVVMRAPVSAQSWIIRQILGALFCAFGSNSGAFPVVFYNGASDPPTLMYYGGINAVTFGERRYFYQLDELAVRSPTQGLAFFNMAEGRPTEITALFSNATTVNSPAVDGPEIYRDPSLVHFYDTVRDDDEDYDGEEDEEGDF